MCMRLSETHLPPVEVTVRLSCFVCKPGMQAVRNPPIPVHLEKAGEEMMMKAFKRLLELLGQTCSASHPAGDDILTSGMKDVHDTIRQGVLCTPSLYVADHDRLITQAVVHVVCCRRQR
ncbi:unnamed protein product [Mesocestoides corti]|uniref:Uncharacterized protein n=1 Tax=Mesocestoides corti TaxID=53468 RepID=A0A0R3UEW3_MESCO|nr:unnamed protein product [Mesocestoides corti]